LRIDDALRRNLEEQGPELTVWSPERGLRFLVFA
jgi:hypothetical protein